MECYLGIDVGTTNTKVLTLSTDGTTRVAASTATPTYATGGVEYFELRSITSWVAETVRDLQAEHAVLGMGFSSIGESVVPLDSAGRALSDPVVWYEEVTRETEQRFRETPGLEDYVRKGIGSDHTLGVYKILWMQQHLEGLESAAYWLPVSSYVAYRYSGTMRWDYSQGCRSYLLDIHERTWQEELLSRLGLEGTLPPAAYMGSYLGATDDGIGIYLGGHDHIVGMNGVQVLFGSGTIYYSVGSASVLGGMVDAAPEQIRQKLQRSADLIVGVGSSPESYYAENSVRYFGKLLEAVSRMMGAQSPGEFYTAMNREIEGATPPEKLPLIFTEGDLLVAHRISGFTMAEVGVDIDQRSMAWAVYLYLAVMTELVFESISEMVGEPTLVAGGGVTQNRTFMQLVSDVLNRPITLIQEAEMTAFGAALTAADGAGDAETIRRTKAGIDRTEITPSPQASLRRDAAHRLRARMEGHLRRAPRSQ
jgi:sugar (pentulose or hexulose) kinase